MLKDLVAHVQGKIKEWDVFYQSSSSTTIVFENNQLKNIEENFSKGIGLRIIQNNKLGFSSCTNFLNIDELISNAIDTARFGEEAFFQFPAKNIENKDLKIYHDDVENLNEKTPIEWGQLFIERLSLLDNKLKINVSIDKHILEKQLYNCKGLNLHDKKSLISIMVSLFRAEENNFLEIYDYKTLTHIPEKTEINAILDNLVLLYQQAKQLKEIKSGYYQVYFTPKAFSTLLSLFLQSFDGKLFEKKVSYFYGKINQVFLKQKIDLIDNPFLAGFPFSRNFDGDGLCPETIFFLHNGVVGDYIVDLQTAGKLKRPSNGHSGRDYTSLPSPGFTNVVFQTNDKALLFTKDKIIQDMHQGIIVDQLLGAGQSNVIGGEFSCNIDLGYFVENGEITGRIKDAMLTCNFFDFFNQISRVENKQYLYSKYFVPSILFDKISVVTKG